MFDSGSSSVSNNKHDNLIQPYAVDPLRNSVDSHESCEPLNSDKTADESSFRPYEDQELQFRTAHHKNNMDVDESGSSSPTLWNSTPRNIELHSHQPSSRAQAIAKGQREMMEIVNNMPESSYELSLKDIVEHHHPIRLDDDDDKTSANQEEYLIQDKPTYFDYRVQQQQQHHRAKKVIKRQVSVKAKMVRSGSVDNNRGLFLKMVFPLTWKQSQKKSTISSSSTTLPTKHVTLTKSTNSDDEISEKSLRTRSRRMGTNTIDKDWSMRRFSSESSNGMNSSSNGTNSSSSGSSNSGCSLKIRNRRSGLLNNYCSCFQ